jgi:hypothetical protein
MDSLDIFTIISYVGLNVDLVFQIRRIYKNKSSKDISLVGLSVRYVAILVILVKFISISDEALIIGQGLILITFTCYFFLALYYLLKKK